jgi:hypothetical protein
MSSYYFFNNKLLLKIQKRNEIVIEPNTAGQNPVITNPGTINEVTQKSPVLMRIPAIPSVSILMGSVKILSTGLIKVLMSPNTNATKSAVRKFATVIPGII